jgi:Xaa-Pro aminopeptidase
MIETPHQSRLKALRELLLSKQLDAYLVLDRSNTFYLTGFAGTFSILLIGCDAAYFITDFRYIERVRKSMSLSRGRHTGYTILMRKRNYGHTISTIARLKGWRRIGFEETITYGDLERLRSADPQRQFCSAPRMIESLRMIKDASELRTIRRAATLCDAVMARIRRFLRPGLTERKIAQTIRTLIESVGDPGSSEAFPTIVASGPNSSMPHHETGDRVLRRGDVVTIDLGIRLEGYCSDITRTFFLGAPPARGGRRVYEIVLEAQSRALERVRPGVAAFEIDRLARRSIARHGYGKFFGHGLGHGVGIDIHEGPYLKREDKTVLSSGMVFTIEPGIYLPGRIGVRIEDMVALSGQHGCEILTHAPKDFSSAVLRI